MQARFWIAVASVMLAATAQAQSRGAEPGADDSICVGGPRWYPLSADTARIEAEPVPASFRATAAERCASMMVNERHLVDWHLAFGNERTLAVALDFIADDYLRGRTRPEDYQRTLRSGWARLERDVRQTGQQTPAERARSVRESEGYRRVDAAVDLDRQYGCLVEWSLRGAEEFRSAPLLARAEQFLTPLVDGARFVAERQTAELRSLGISFDFTDFRIDDFRMRTTILRARLTGRAADLSAAESLMAEMYRPVFLQAADNATADGFCEFEEEPRLEALRGACREDNFSPQVMNYWINRAMLDLLQNAGRSQDDRALELLLLAERCCSFSRGHYREATDDRRRLLMARIERSIRKMDTEIARGERHDAIGSGFDALNDLQGAERLVTPFDRPRYFQEIATTWLALWERVNGLYAPADERPEPGVTAMRERYAAYLRLTLASLDSIRVGAAPRLPRRPN